MPSKITIYLMILLSFLSINITAKANILEDIKNGLQSSKNKSSKNLAQSEQDETENEVKKVCEIQKGYAIKHFENRQQERTKEIQEKLSRIIKVKSLLDTNKQDINTLNLTIENLNKLLKQKIEILKSRTKDTSLIDCKDLYKGSKTRSDIKEFNQNLNKLDKEIKVQTREFSSEVQRLIIKMKQPKLEEVK